LRHNNFKSDNVLIERLSAGDESAFSEIYHMYASDLIGFASSKVYSMEIARDLVQDVFTCLWTDRKKHQIHTSIQSYLFGITRHRIIDHIRKNVTREQYASMLQVLSLKLENSLENSVEAKDLNDFIQKAVVNLPPRTKEIYHLSRNEDKSIPEIAQMLNISDQTVKNQITSALKFLRTLLGCVILMTIKFLFY
jgi:RNA polymerase sigma-70 factor (family 1)